MSRLPILRYATGARSRFHAAEHTTIQDSARRAGVAFGGFAGTGCVSNKN